MQPNQHFDVIIIGGSYAGLSAAMTLGRSLRKVLIVDNGKPCNRQTPFSHNFLTQDRIPPARIAEAARKQALAYETVNFQEGTVTTVVKQGDFFTVTDQQNNSFSAAKILFATGVKDIMPNISGFAACWGISVLHCPYCHGYEVKNKNIGILANGPTAFKLCKLIQHWTDKLTLYTNGKADLNTDQKEFLSTLNIQIVEHQIKEIEHRSGYLQKLHFNNGTEVKLEAIFSRVQFRQHCEIPMTLGCKLTEEGHLVVDPMQKTTIDGMFAAGDNCTPLRAVSIAIAAGTKAGAVINMELIEEKLEKTKVPIP